MYHNHSIYEVFDYCLVILLFESSVRGHDPHKSFCVPPIKLLQIYAGSPICALSAVRVHGEDLNTNR